MKKSLLKYPKTEKEFTILKVHKYPLTEDTNMISVNLIKKSVMGGVILIGLSLLSQPAQAINIKYSFDSGDDGLSTITKTDSGSGITFTASNPNANGGNFKADNYGLALGTVNTLGNGITEFSLSFSQAVSLNSYVIGYVESGGIYPFSLATSTDNPINVVGTYNFNNPFTLTANQNYTLSTSRSLSLSRGLSQISSITVDATAVPWETDALPVIGSTILFGFGLWAKNKFAKPLQK